MEWLLQQRPGGLLSALIDLALHFHSLLSQQGNRRVFKGGESPSRYSSGGANSLSQLPSLMIVLYKIAWYVFYLSFFHFFTSPFFSLPPPSLSSFLSLPLPSLSLSFLLSLSPSLVAMRMFERLQILVCLMLCLIFAPHL